MQKNYICRKEGKIQQVFGFVKFAEVFVRLYWFSKLEKKENFLALSKPIFIKVVSALWVFQKVKELSDSCVKFGVESGCWSHVPIITELRE